MPNRIHLACWNIVTSSKIDENAVKDIGLSSSKWFRHRPRKLGHVGSSPTGSDIFREFLSIFKFRFFIVLKYFSIDCCVFFHLESFRDIRIIWGQILWFSIRFNFTYPNSNLGFLLFRIFHLEFFFCNIEMYDAEFPGISFSLIVPMI